MCSLYVMSALVSVRSFAVTCAFTCSCVCSCLYANVRVYVRVCVGGRRDVLIEHISLF